MMFGAPPSVTRLIETLSELPGIGPKTASRLTFFLLRGETDLPLRLADALRELKERTRFCSVCFNITEADPCPICSDPARDRSSICVVEEPLDVLAIERTEQFRGLYHVLHGALSPMEGIFAENLRVAELLQRVQSGTVTEVILATNPTGEGDYTAAYLLSKLRPMVARLTRLGRGLPVGGDLEYADQVTLANALDGRQDL
ncbi:MAG: recombination protein RecR [Anaerolineae bacterium]|nr:recombination protein RecR [Anaerolineae bacterium]